MHRDVSVMSPCLQLLGCYFSFSPSLCQIILLIISVFLTLSSIIVLCFRSLSLSVSPIIVIISVFVSLSPIIVLLFHFSPSLSPIIWLLYVFQFLSLSPVIVLLDRFPTIAMLLYIMMWFEIPPSFVLIFKYFSVSMDPMDARNRARYEYIGSVLLIMFLKRHV